MDREIEKIKSFIGASKIHKSLDYVNKLLKKNKNPIYFNIKGALLLMSDQNKLAIDPLLKAIKLAPEFPDPYANLGMVYHKIDQNEKAINYLNKAIDLNNDFIEAKYNLASIFFATRKFFEAIELLKNILLLDLKNTNAYILLGDAYNETNNVNEALKCHQEAVKLNLNANNLYSLGYDYLYLGNIERAMDCFRPTLPSHIPSYLGLATHTDYQFNKSDIQYLTHYFHEGQDNEKKALCGFTLARILKKQKKFKDSFEILIKANDLKKIDSLFDQKAFLEKVKNIQEFYLAIKSRKIEFSHDNLRPIFILGPPRSGTTFLEQIITNHPEVYGAGEICKLEYLFDDLISKKNITESSLVNLRNDYYAYVKKMTDKKYFVDKTPFNSFYLGLIKIVFPESLVINTKRNFKSIAFSMYENNFSSGGLNYTYSQENIVFYLKNYKENMLFWAQQKFDNFLTLDLKTFVGNLENESKKVFTFLGLDFKIDYMDVTKNKKAVRTVSAGQVRNKKSPTEMYTEDNYGKVIEKFNLLIDSI